MNKRIRKTHKPHSTRLGDNAPARASTELGRKSFTGTRGRGRGMQELVMVATASTMDEAKENETLLKNNEIPAMVKQRPNEFGEGTHYAVLVPEDMADEAHVIIESQDAYDDFYDLGLNDESEDDLEGEIFED
ncbi:MAG: hypothetical protein ABSA64_06260 [Sedimentisphaerales bacterium]